MFQSFKAPESTFTSARILARLREEMKREKIDWYLVPHADEHQNEYLPERAERLAYLTAFTGSAGFAIVGLHEAHLFVDGRYTMQAEQQVDSDCFTLQDLVRDTPSTFAKSLFTDGDVAGFDPWLITIGQKETWEKAVKKSAASLKPVRNLIDAVWEGQPDAPKGKAWLHPGRYAGRVAQEKLADIRRAIIEDGADFHLQTDPASLAWTFNLRGSDLVHNPLVLGWSIIPVAEDQRPLVFTDEKKLTAADRNELAEIADIRPEGELQSSLKNIAPENKIHCDPALVASALGEVINTAGGKIISGRDPVALLRAVKNETELAGAREAHIRDGVAMVRFLAWLNDQEPGSVDEISAAKKLENCRAETARQMGSELREISFDTISGAGANGAIVHYRVSEETNAVLKDGSLYLVDSGGQYPDGTTDITRTIAIGKPPAEAINDNTLVLKGHIAIAQARFPEGTRGVDLDILARNALWQQGKDFAHGTGHGVGSYLNVHEGPQSISRRGMEPLKPGMIISNEPGYYREGVYGIRIENLVIVTEAADIAGGDKPMMAFETITLCPIDLRLIDPDLLSSSEIDWLNAYHSRVRDSLSPHLEGTDLDWLKSATKTL